MDCLFCKIASGSIPVKRVYEDEHVIAFPDIHPQAPTHILLIPKRHFGSLAQTSVEDAGLLGHLLAAAAEVARQQQVAPGDGGGGYRLVVNTGEDGGQTVEHLHVHLLGGRHMGWPPG
ncbi:MAG: histidine triad nucleotide-binding protein [Acidobacteria bacterium]|nr:histidine triad nucleotide-binding protein [Acidobacteriota bacterium]